MIERIRMIESSIFITTSFIGLHHWPSAPDAVAYLRDLHRHEFKVRAELFVEHKDRELEFIQVKSELDEWLSKEYLTRSRQFDQKSMVTPNLGRYSCEDMATEIIAFLEERYPDRVRSVEVSEDGENGAILRVRLPPSVIGHGG